MRGLNKVMIICNLGADPELRYTGNGTAVCNMRGATNESYKNAQGEWVEKTEWHSIVAWAKLAEICNEYLKKGSQVYFEGSIQTRKYQDRDGQDRYTTEIKVREMMMLDTKGSTASDDSAPADAPAAEEKGKVVESDDGTLTFDPDDAARLPF